MQGRLFFGEYLVQNKIVEPEDLLRALERQQEQTPSFEQMASKLAYLSMKQIFKILTYEAGTDLSFEEAAIKLEFMTEAQVEEVRRSILVSRPPIGSILASMNLVPADVIKQALVSFRKQNLQYLGMPEKLLKIKIFSNLPKNILSTFAYIAKIETFEPGTVLVKKGDVVVNFSCLAEGSVKVSADGDGDGQKQGPARVHDRLINAGDYFGEISLFGKFKASETATVERKTRLVQFNGELFANLLKDHPKTMMDFFLEITRQLLKKVKTSGSDWPL